MAFSHSPKIVTDGLVVCIDAADRNSYPGSGATITDISGNNNDGDLSNSPSFDTANGGSIELDGTNQSIIIPEWMYSGMAGFTIQCTFRIPTWVGGSQQPAIFGIHGAGGTYCRWTAETTLLTYFNGATNNQSRYSTSVPSVTNKFYITTHTYDVSSTTIKIYFDTLLKETISVDLGLPLNTQPTGIGRYAGASSYYFNGYYYSFRAYDRALSTDEVLQNYNATKSRFGL